VTRVVIFTHRRAQEVDGVIDALRAMGASVIRVNWCQYPDVSPYSVDSDVDGIDVLNDARVGWLHEPYLFSVGRSLTGLARDIALRECGAFWDGVLADLRCHWLNDPGAVRRASSKVAQLRLATQLGIPVPAYTVTNDQTRARDFILGRHSAVIKSLCAGYTEYGERHFKSFTRRIGATDSSLLESLRSGPAILQEEICKVREIRTTVIDDQCYSVEFDCTRLPLGTVDMRQLDYTSNQSAFRRASSPERIETWSKAMTTKLGLSYACFDWARDRNGQEFFLECNPLGSFKWSELCGDWSISEAIASALIGRTTTT
jgi:glutathione synthase/RimK-type ligase-like ATP-grasp enzyme